MSEACSSGLKNVTYSFNSNLHKLKKETVGKFDCTVQCRSGNLSFIQSHMFVLRSGFVTATRVTNTVFLVLTEWLKVSNVSDDFAASILRVKNPANSVKDVQVAHTFHRI